MAKALKGIGIAVAVIAVLLVAAIVILSAVVDEDFIKKELGAATKSATGGELRIDGELNLSVFPQLGISVEALQFTPAGEQSPLAAIGTLRMGIDFMPLLSGNISVGEITLDGLKLDMVRRKDGSSNWDSLVKESSEEPTSEAPAEPAASSGESAALALAVSEINITNTSIRFTDEAEDKTSELKDFYFKSAGVNLDGSPFPASLGFVVSTAELDMDFDLESQLSGDFKAMQFKLDQTHATINMSGEATGGLTLASDLKANLALDLGADTAAISDLALNLNDLVLTGDINVAELTTEPALSGQLHTKPFNARKLAGNFGAELPDFTNDKALTRLSFGTHFALQGNQASLTKLKAEMDETVLSGSIKLTDIEKQAIVARLTINKLNLDNYEIRVSEESSEPGKPATTTTVTPAPILPRDTVMALDLDAVLSIGQLIASNVKLDDASLTLRAKDGVVNLKELKAGLYQGTTNFNAVIDARPKQPKWSFNGSISKVNAKPLLKDAAEMDFVEGIVNLQAKLTTVGNLENDVKYNLSGPVSFSFTEARLKDMNLEQKVCQAIAVINRQRLSTKWGADTELDDVKGQLQFGQGVMRNTSLTAGLKNTKLTGKGDVNIMNETLDYKLGVTVIGEMKEIDPACEVNPRYKDISWPLRCKGSFSDETSELCGVDQDGLNKVIEQIAKKELEKKAGGALRRLFER